MKHPSQQLLQVMTLNNSPGPYDDNYYKVQFKIACLAGAEGGVGKSEKKRRFIPMLCRQNLKVIPCSRSTLAGVCFVLCKMSQNVAFQKLLKTHDITSNLMLHYF